MTRTFPASFFVGRAIEPGGIVFNSALFFREESSLEGFFYQYISFVPFLSTSVRVFKDSLFIYCMGFLKFPFDFLIFIFLRQRKQSQDLKRHHRKLKLEKGILVPSKGKLIIKNISLLLKKEILSNLLRRKPLLFESLWTLNGRL